LYVRERSLYLMCSFILSQCRDLRTGVTDMREFRCSGDSTSHRILDVLESFYLRLSSVLCVH